MGAEVGFYDARVVRQLVGRAGQHGRGAGLAQQAAADRAVGAGISIVINGATIENAARGRYLALLVLDLAEAFSQNRVSNALLEFGDLLVIRLLEGFE